MENYTKKEKIKIVLMLSVAAIMITLAISNLLAHDPLSTAHAELMETEQQISKWKFQEEQARLKLEVLRPLREEQTETINDLINQPLVGLEVYIEENDTSEVFQ